MSDTVFRAKVERRDGQEELPKGKIPAETPREDRVEVPYLDYEQAKGKPFAVEYFGLSNTWDDPDGGFSQEVALVEEYFENKIKSGGMANSQSAVKKELKEIEKLANLEKDERTVVRLGTISAYLKFLMECDKIKYNLRRYAST